MRKFTIQSAAATQPRIDMLRAATYPSESRPPVFELPEAGPGRFSIAAVLDVPGAVEVYAVEVGALVDFVEARGGGAVARDVTAEEQAELAHRHGEPHSHPLEARVMWRGRKPEEAVALGEVGEGGGVKENVERLD